MVARTPRFHIYFTPTSSSWLNLVEGWFSEITSRWIRRGTHRSVKELSDSITHWITTWNEDPRPYVWHKAADEILESLGRYLELIVDAGHYDRDMSLEGTYEPSPSAWVRDQVEAYERSGGAQANTLRDTGLPIVVVTTIGNKSRKVRKTPLMRVEHEGEYALVASKGGAPTHPVWYYNLLSDPDGVQIQDGPEPHDCSVREISGDERSVWWERAVAAYPPYAEYQAKTDRLIPVFVATRRG